MPITEIISENSLISTTSNDSIPDQIIMTGSDIASLIPPQLEKSLPLPSDIQEEEGSTIAKKIKKHFNDECESYDKFTRSDYPYSLIFKTRKFLPYILPQDKTGSSKSCDHSPIGPLTISRSCLFLSALSSAVTTKSIKLVSKLAIFCCYNHTWDPVMDELDDSLFHIVKIPMAVPFVMAGTALQSAICLVPCLVSNALNLATKKQHDDLQVLASSSIVFFSNGMTLDDHLKTLKKIYPDVSEAVDTSKFFEELFFKFKKDDFPNPQLENHLPSFRCFLDNPSYFLDDISTSQSHFFGSKLGKQNLTKMIENISYGDLPIIGRIDKNNKILYLFAFNCLVFNFLSDIKDKYPELVSNTKNFDAIKDKFQENISQFKEHIKKYVDESPNMEGYKLKLEAFFDICENHYGRIEILDVKDQDSQIHNKKALILSYENGKEKIQKKLTILSETPSQNFLKPIRLSGIASDKSQVEIISIQLGFAGSM